MNNLTVNTDKRFYILFNHYDKTKRSDGTKLKNINFYAHPIFHSRHDESNSSEIIKSKRLESNVDLLDYHNYGCSEIYVPSKGLSFVDTNVYYEWYMIK